MSDLLQSIFWLFLLTFLVAGCGLIAGSFFKKGNISEGNRFLRDQLLGLLLLVGGFAFIKTSGLTVLLGLIVPGLAGFLHYYKKPSLRDFFIRKEYLILLISLLVISFICAIPEFLWMYDPEKGILLQVPHFDYLYYAKIAGFMSGSGAENRLMSLNSLYPEYNLVRTPYHYPEIWLNAFLHSITGKSTLKTEMLVVYPYLKGLFLSVLFVAVKEKFKNIKNWESWVLSIILASITGVFFKFYMGSSWLKYHDGITQSGAMMSFGRKYLFMMIYIAYAVLILWKSERYYLFFLLMSVIPLFSIGTLPGILLSSTGSALYLLYRKRIRLKTVFSAIGAGLITALFLVTFYAWLGDRQSNTNIQQSVLIIKLIQSPGLVFFKQFFFAAFFPTLRTLIMYLPWLFLILILVGRKFDRGLLILAFLAIAGGNLAAAMATGILDNGQFYYNILPMFNILLVAIFLQAKDIHLVSSALRKLMIILAILISVYQFYTDFNYYRGSIRPYNTLNQKDKVRNLNRIQQAASNNPITGLYQIDSSELSGLSFLDTYYRNRHFYLQFADQYRDALNINSQSYLDKGDSLWSVDQYLLGQNELAVFLRRENLPLRKETLEKFYIKTGSIFFVEADSLYLEKQLPF